MYVIYRDTIGLIRVDIDGYNIDFLDGYAYFSNDDRDYKININDICCIRKV